MNTTNERERIDAAERADDADRFAKWASRFSGRAHLFAHAAERGGLAIVRTPTGIGVGWTVFPPPFPDRPLLVEVEYGGKRLKDEYLDPYELPWRDCYAGLDMLRVAVRVKDSLTDTTITDLPAPDDAGLLPFMRLHGEQVYVTENYVSVPPALTLTDDVGAVWTLGFKTAPKELSPEGEFAFDVLRDGIDAHEVASRIERRGGKIRIFTRHGWKVWSSEFLSFF